MNKHALWMLTGLAFLCKPVFSQDKPNFLVIVTDDQTFDAVGALSNTKIHTPNLDRLVHNGTTFTHVFNQGSWSGAVSVASRCMLITGQYLNNAVCNDAYLSGWARSKHQKPATEVPLLGETFRKNGYKTFVTGKWHNENQALLRSFDEGEVIGSGFYESLDANGKKLQYHRPAENSIWNPSDPQFNGHWTPKVNDIVVQDGKTTVSKPYILNQHTSEAYGEAAIRFIHKQKNDTPFFMYVAFNAPHDPRQSPKRFVEMYPTKDIELPPSFLPQHPFDQGDSKIRDEVLAPFPRTEEAIRLHRQEYYAIISHADEVIGRIIDELERSGLDKNTYIIFTSDHGLAVGNHGLMGKQNLYDHTLRVPFIVKGPNIKQGARVDGMIYMQSLYATACDLAGIPTPSTVDFPSVVPFLKDPQKKGEEYVWASYCNYQHAVRSEKYKLIIYPKVKRIQLFDIQKDPYETKNLVGNKKYAKDLNKMFNVLLEKEKEFGDGDNLGKLTDYK